MNIKRISISIFLGIILCNEALAMDAAQTGAAAAASSRTDASSTSTDTRLDLTIPKNFAKMLGQPDPVPLFSQHMQECIDALFVTTRNGNFHAVLCILIAARRADNASNRQHNFVKTLLQARDTNFDYVTALHNTAIEDNFYSNRKAIARRILDAAQHENILSNVLSAQDAKKFTPLKKARSINFEELENLLLEYYARIPDLLQRIAHKAHEKFSKIKHIRDFKKIIYHLVLEIEEQTKTISPVEKLRTLLARITPGSSEIQSFIDTLISIQSIDEVKALIQPTVQKQREQQQDDDE